MVAELAGESVEDRRAFARDRLSANFSNYSAHHALAKTLPESMDAAAAREELSNARQALFCEPDDQSTWWFSFDVLRRSNYATVDEEVAAPLHVVEDLPLSDEALRQALFVPPLLDDQLLVLVRDRVDVGDQVLLELELLPQPPLLGLQFDILAADSLGLRAQRRQLPRRIRRLESDLLRLQLQRLYLLELACVLVPAELRHPLGLADLGPQLADFLGEVPFDDEFLLGDLGLQVAHAAFVRHVVLD